MTRAALLVVPALLLPIAAVLALMRTLPESLVAAVNVAALVVFGGGALLGLIIRRGRLILGLVVLDFADRALVHFGGRAVFDAVALLLPVNLGVITWIGEASLPTPRGAARLGVILLQAGVVALLQRPELAALATPLERPLIAANLGSWTALPQFALAAFAVALGLVLTRMLVDGRPFAAGTAGALVASLLALDVASAGGPATVHFVTAGLLLIAGFVWEPRRIAYRDDVTGLPMRLVLNTALRRLPRRYAVACVEIDEFRTFREEHGAEAAHRMLRRVAEALAKVGGRGRAFYCGAHTFAVLFRRTSAEAAARHLDVVRRTVEAATLDVRVPERTSTGQPVRVVERTVSVTISVGVAQPEGRGADSHEVLRAAEGALARAQQAGQNRVST